MQFRQKIGYMALGGLLVLGGHVLPGLVVQKATAQAEGNTSAEFDTITVRSLRVLDNAGRVRATLEVTDRDSTDPVEDVIQVFNGTRVPVYRVGVSSEGGTVSTYGNNGIARVLMSVSPEGGVVLVCDDDGKPRAAMAVDQDGGGVSTLDRWGSVTGMLP